MRIRVKKAAVIIGVCAQANLFEWWPGPVRAWVSVGAQSG